MISRRSVIAALAAAGLIAAAAPAWAAYPEKPIRLVVPFSPGGGTDAIARALGTLLSQSLGQTVLVDNRPGASTMIGSEFVAKAAPDGYTLLIATLAHAVNPSMQHNMAFDTEKGVRAGHADRQLVQRPGRAPGQQVPQRGRRDRRGQGQSRQALLRLAGVAARRPIWRANCSTTSPMSSCCTFLTAAPGRPLIDVLGGRVDMMFATNAASAPLHRRQAVARARDHCAGGQVAGARRPEHRRDHSRLQPR